MKIQIDLCQISNRITRNGIAEEVKSPKILDKLSNDEAWEVRRTVAKNPNTAKATLTRLSKDVKTFMCERQ